MAKEAAQLAEPSSHEPKANWAPHVRPPTTGDLKYIRETWLSSYRTSPYAGCVPNNLFDALYNETINQLIARGMKFTVVANPASPDLLLGWLAYETSGSDVCVHYAFTKPLYRRLGINSHLLASVASGPFFYTFRTSSSKYLKGGRFRPEIARRREWKATSKPSVH